MNAAVRPVPSEPEVLDRAGSENFSVASVVLGRANRDHLMAIYGFARLVDQLGDDVEGNRLAHLDRLADDLDRIYDGGEPEHPVMVTLSRSVRALALPREPFVRLIEANRRDQRQSTYETYADLLAYCDLSANPVGELVLHVFGAATPGRIALSNDICTALQVIEHLQDVEEDAERGRVYIPPGSADDYAERARALLDEGAPLVGTLRGRARLAVAGYVGGGRAALGALAHGSRKATKAHRLRETLKTLVRGR
jgi:phytoene/squalene synthetase